MARRGKRKKQKDAVPHRRTAPGSAPGTLSADPNAPKPSISVMAFDADRLEERSLQDASEIRPFLEKYPVTWINVDGLGDADVIGSVGEVLGLHPLSLEDVLNVHQRAKLEEYEDYLYVVARQVQPGDEIVTEQLSVFLGARFVVTLQEEAGDCFDPVRDRIRKALGKVRKAQCDYLAYAVLDAVVDHYFPVLEGVSDRLELLEEEAIHEPRSDLPARLQHARHELLTLRRAVWPLREALSTLYRDDTPLVSDDTRVYLRDCYDHVIQVLDVLETHREIASGLMDIYLSSVSNRMNEVMKVLTVIATIFIPLTFVSSIYGMNFDPHRSRWNMPELEWDYGYPFALGLMLLMAAALLFYFRKKGWLGGEDVTLPPPRHDD
ncbi:MAG: magnesium/cobalt transporter CorA [Myxococcales bacterium]|nr:magnesium/cobalt transporter CorA [Myxococcales bacterium]MCB9582449.1 magnesium/cobalt transporter CorA [Polyangiaceae bacterium]